MGKPAKEFWGEVWEHIGPSILQVKKGGEATWNKNQLLSIYRNGEIQDAYWTYGFSAVRDESGEIAGIIAIITETTEAFIAMNSLEESEKRFRRMAENSSIMIALSDKTKNVTYSNRTWIEFTGRSLQELIDYGWSDLIHPKDKDYMVTGYENNMDKRRNFKVEFRMLDKTGQYRWIAAHITPRFTKDGSFDGAVSSTMDIHERKMFSHHLEEEVKSRTEELKQANLELKKSNEELQDFNYISSHDFQEPLRKIQTFTSQLLDKEYENLSQWGQKKFERMQSAAHRMQALIQDLLAYSRTEMEDRKFEQVSFREILDNVKKDLEEELEETGAKLKLTSSCMVQVIFQIRQLLYNLIANSLKFRKEDHSLVVEVSAKILGASGNLENGEEKASPICQIRISDNGIGFDQRYADKIFEVFQRLHNRSEYEGTGIGLVIVKKIVENHKGSIRAIGESGRGAVFEIQIPNQSYNKNQF